MVMFEFKKGDCILRRGCGTIKEYDSQNQNITIQLGNKTKITGKCLQERYSQIDDSKNVIFLVQYFENSRTIPEILKIHNDDLTLDEFKAIYIKTSLLQSQIE